MPIFNKLLLALLVFSVAVFAQDKKVKVKYLPPDKGAFDQYCVANGAPYLGATLVKDVCGCAYDKIAEDPARYAELLQSPDAQKQAFIGYEFFVACAPEYFNDEMEAALSKACIDNGMPQKVCPCIARYIRNEYPVKKFLEIVLYDRAQMAAILATYSAKCMIFH